MVSKNFGDHFPIAALTKSLSIRLVFSSCSEGFDGLDHLGTLLELNDHGLLVLDVLDEGDDAVLVDATASVIFTGELEQAGIVGHDLLDLRGLRRAHV